METRHDILEKAGHKTGYTVPEGYFDSVRSKIMLNLPEYQEEKPEKLSKWKRVQPYIYMAAMFAGIWCMMKMFHMMTTTDLSLDNPPATVALAMADPDHNAYWISETDNSEVFELEDELCDSYDSFDDFKKDFDNTL